MTPGYPSCSDDLGYPDDAAHLRDELLRLDLLIRLRAARLRAPRPTAAALERSLYVADDEIEALLADEPDGSPAPALIAELAALTAVIDRGVAASAADGVALRLPRLGDALGLTSFERHALVVCLAPELRRRYDRLYAWLQDDITRKRPSVDLVLDLLCADEPQRWRARALVGETGALRRRGVLEAVADPASPSGSSGLAQFLRLDPRVLAHLLADDRPDPRLDGVARLRRAPAKTIPDVDHELVARLARLSAVAPRVHLHGPDGLAHEELARYTCARLGVDLLVLDGPALLTAAEPASLLRCALRDARLRGCAVHLGRADALWGEQARAVRSALDEDAAEVAAEDAAVGAAEEPAVGTTGLLVLSSGPRSWPHDAAPARGEVASVAVAAPDTAARAAVWRDALAGRSPQPAVWARTLAARYRLGPGRIRSAVAGAAVARVLEGDASDAAVGAADGPLRLDDLAAACRAQSDRRLGELATPVRSAYGWADLVLPDDRLAVLREIADQVRHHTRVWDEWGFARRIAYGRGLSALFSGPPGTGKTMAAQVLARDIGLDLYRVDLSRVVSKYIGETEKNLSQIFDEADAADAILFFDEADALFGKRSEVSDAHDRYANIETGYLLQRMEEHEGVVVLATNLRQNLDEAFTRRIRFLVDFPFPDEEHRRLIWQTHFPAPAPVAPEVDCAALAREFPVAGGSIRNTILNAAFLAAADGGTIRPEHLLRGLRREFDKIGKVWSDPR
jgi:Winged helix domain, variant/ATPase family associated with various cellular activities (AAA)